MKRKHTFLARILEFLARIWVILNHEKMGSLVLNYPPTQGKFWESGNFGKVATLYYVVLKKGDQKIHGNIYRKNMKNWHKEFLIFQLSWSHSLCGSFNANVAFAWWPVRSWRLLCIDSNGILSSWRSGQISNPTAAAPNQQPQIYDAQVVIIIY